MLAVDGLGSSSQGVHLLHESGDEVPTGKRAFTDTFAGIRLVDAPMFIVAQIAGAVAATWLFQWLTHSLPAVGRPPGRATLRRRASADTGVVGRLTRRLTAAQRSSYSCH